jgi:hypothetical protein
VYNALEACANEHLGQFGGHMYAARPVGRKLLFKEAFERSRKKRFILTLIPKLRLMLRIDFLVTLQN